MCICEVITATKHFPRSRWMEKLIAARDCLREERREIESLHY
jgi:hypothetical protein